MRFVSLRVFLALIFWLAGGLYAHAEAIRIATIGDSITNGWPYFKYPPGNGARWGGFQPKLESKLVNAGHDAVVLNYGWSGESTFPEAPEYSGGRDRLAGVLAASSPHYVLLQYGTNDLDYVNHPPVYAASQIVANLSDMVDAVRQAGATPILSTLTPDINTPKDIAGTNQAIKALAKSKNVILADMYAAVTANWNALTSDGLHPNQEGYQALADVWFDVLLKQLEPQQPPRARSTDLTPILQLLLD